MDQLIEQLMKHSGLSREQALSAIEIISRHLKERLPAPLASQVELVLAGEHDDTLREVQKGLSGLGGLFGKK